MTRQLTAGFLACVLFALSPIARADIKVVVDHNDNDHATAAFKFKDVPSPLKTNAVSTATFKIVDGEKDDAGGDLEVLHDGKLPGEADEPISNFFFNAGTEGGRVLIDLGNAISIKQIDTYSWHTDTRAPQVYTLYGSDGKAAKFNSSPTKETDPATCGWTLITKVDTRPKTGESGGQYGVSISDSAGAIGSYRYLLLSATRTESDDDFGNTFFSEINVIDANELLGAPKGTSGPNVKTLSMSGINGAKYSATIDTTETPDLTQWCNDTLAPVVVEWYPKLVAMLPSDGYSAPDHFSITFRADKKGVADTAGTRINCAATWYRGNLKTEALGSIVHEMVHVVQQYGAMRRTHPKAQTPGWLVEGIPDYIRWYEFEPTPAGANISKRGYDKANYDGMYRISANFLNFVVQKHDKNLIREVNNELREGTYTDLIWPKLTGKSLPDLNDEWKADLAKKLGM